MIERMCFITHAAFTRASLLAAGALLSSVLNVHAQDGNFRYITVANPGSSLGTVTSVSSLNTQVLNDNGVLVGKVNTASGAAPAFYSINGAAAVQINNISANGLMTGVSINNNGLILGTETFSAGGVPNAWYYKIGVSGSASLMTAPAGLPAAITSYNLGSNNNDQVVGWVTAGANSRAFRWNPTGGLPTNAPISIAAATGAGINTGALSVNNNNLAVGLGQNGSNAVPALYDLNNPANSVLLGTNGFGLARASSINDAGIIVGSERRAAGSPSFAFIFSTNAPVPIPGFGGAAQGTATYVASGFASIANISSNNLVAFGLNDGSPNLKAAIFSSLTPTTSYDLNTLVAAGFSLPGNVNNIAINKNGQLAGDASVGTNTQTVMGTPELNWRNGLAGGSGASGNWDDANAWSWGVTPSNMHPVFVNRASAGSLTVTLDGSNKQVAELNIGTSGSGQATLQITNRTLRVTENDGSTFGDYTRWSTGISTIASNGILQMTGATLNSDQGISLTGSLVSTASGTTSVVASSAGNLNLNAGNRTINVADGAAATDMNITAIITNGSLTKSGTGLLQLSAANTFTGGVTVNGGVLHFGHVGALNATAGQQNSVNLGAAGTLRLNGFSATIGNSGAAATGLTGSGIAENGAAGTATLTISHANASVQTFSGTLQNGSAGTLALAKSGTGTTILSGTNTYTGGTVINAGVLQVSSDPNLGANTGALAFSGGTLRFGSTFNLSGSRAIIVNAGGGTIDTNGNNTTVSQSISGAGALTKSGTGTLILSNNNTYTGTTISGGTLQIGNSGATGSVSGNITNNAALVFNRSDTPTFAGVISGNGSLAQNGTGTLTLSAANIYTGTTTVNSGILSITGSLANTATVVNNGGTLQGTGSIGGNVNVASGGHISPGLSPGTLTVSSLTMTAGAVFDLEIASLASFDRVVVGTGSTTILNGATLAGVKLAGFVAPFDSSFKIIDNASGGSVTGTFAGLAEGAYFNISGQTFQIRYDVGTFSVSGGVFTTLTPGGSVVIAAVPEASTLAMIGFAMVALVGVFGIHRYRLRIKDKVLA